MMTTIALLAGVIFSLYQAVYVYLRAAYEHEPVVVNAWMILWFAVAAVLCLVATVVPLRVGLRRMERFDF
jgi:hypothetical protein